MKIFNVENGVRKVYIQLGDVAALMCSDEVIPVSMVTDLMSNVFIVANDNRFEFCELSKPGELELLERVDWIIDFKKYIHLSEEELEEEICKIKNEMEELRITYNNLSDEERFERQGDIVRYDCLEHKLASVNEILLIKQGIRIMPFPIVPDSDGLSLDNDNYPLIARQGVNPLQMLIYRKDGKTFEDDNMDISQAFLQATDMLIVNQNLESNEYFGDFEINRKLTEDKKYLVTTFRIMSKSEINHRYLTENNSKNKDSIGKRLVNRITKLFKNNK